MGWKDDPVIGGTSQPVSGGGWQNDPVVGASSSTSAPSSSTSDIPLFSLTGKDKAGEWLNTAIDSGTMGAGDWLAGHVGSLFGGPNTDELRKQTQAGRDDIGPYGSLTADAAGYLVGPGKFKLGARVAEGVGGALAKIISEKAAGRLAGAVGGAAEGAVSSGAGALGHGQDLGTAATDAVMGGVGGGILSGVLGGVERPGVLGKTPVMASPVDEATLDAAHQAARAPMKSVLFNHPDVESAYTGGINGMTPAQRAGVSPEMRTLLKNQVGESRNAGTPSADDINGFARGLFTSGAIKNDADYALAGKIRSNLTQDVLGRAQPVSGHQAGEASVMNDVANQAFARLKDKQWISNATINDAPSEAAARVADPTKIYGPNEKDALNNLASYAPKPAAANPPTSPWAGAAQSVGQGVKDLASDRIVPSAVGWAFGGLPLGVGTMLGSLGIKAGAGAIKANRNAEIQRAMDAAHVALTTGRQINPSDYIGPARTRNVVRGILYGAGAGNDPGPFGQ